MPAASTDDRVEITAALVHRLVASQFPQWADLPVRPVAAAGWDNRTFHLGDDLKVRLPSAARYAAQADKEHRWLPRLAPSLPLPIPVPLATGAPAEGYPWAWSVQRWIEGDTTSQERLRDERRFATDLAAFLLALQRIPAADGPRAGAHNFHRGGPLAVYDAETRSCLAALKHQVDTTAAAAVWEAALAAEWRAPPVWVHGDIAVGNLLLRDGRLAAVIDFGTCAVGDPACDLVIAWTFLSDAGRGAFRAALPADAATWARARGWALWKALLLLARGGAPQPAEASPRQVVAAALAEHASIGKANFSQILPESRRH